MKKWEFNDDIPADEAVGLIRAVERYINSFDSDEFMTTAEKTMLAILGIEKNRGGRTIMANLYEINESIVAAFERGIDAETGEILSEKALEELAKLEMERDEKVEGIALWIKNLLADAEVLKKEKEVFAQRQKAAENRAASLKKYLAGALAGQKFETSKVKISFRKSESVEVMDISKVDDDYLKYAEPTADKTKIKKALKDGVDLQGVRLVEGKNIQIK